MRMTEKCSASVRVSVQSGACLVGIASGLLISGAAHAGIGMTPFSLSLSQDLTYDSNVERVEGGRADTVSATSVTAGFDKQYGRQTYSAALTGLIQRFQDLSIYNNDGFTAEVKVASDLGDRSRVNASFLRSRSLQDFENRSGVSDGKRVVTNSNLGLRFEHGLIAQWKVMSDAGYSTADYDKAAEENRTSRSLRVGVRHSPSDLLYFETGLRHTMSDFPKRRVLQGSVNEAIGEQINRWDVDFQAGLTMTGLSQLTARLNLTKEKQDTKDASKPDDSARDFSGVTGSLAWSYTPRGKLSYLVSLSRDTNNSGGFTSTTYTSLRDRLNTSLDVTALWRLTQKLNVRGNAGVTHIQEQERLQLDGDDLSEDSSGTRGKVSLSLNYDLDRNWGFSCEVVRTERTRTVFNSGFSSNLYSCNGTFLMD